METNLSNMEFNPHDTVIQLCMQGMATEDKGNNDEAASFFLQAWDEAQNDFEKFIAAHYVARRQKDLSDKLKWCETALHYALQVDDYATKSALPTLYLNISTCYEEMGKAENAKTNERLADSLSATPSDNGPFFHGTKADLKVGDLLTAGRFSNYQAELLMNHIYFTALVNGAGLAASLAKGDGPERVYIVEPTGTFENDPNVTDKKFPGNLTRSYRTQDPLKVIGEVADWRRQTPDDIQKWREKLANNKGEIIN